MKNAVPLTAVGRNQDTAYEYTFLFDYEYEPNCSHHSRTNCLGDLAPSNEPLSSSADIEFEDKVFHGGPGAGQIYRDPQAGEQRSSGVGWQGQSRGSR